MFGNHTKRVTKHSSRIFHQYRPYQIEDDRLNLIEPEPSEYGFKSEPENYTFFDQEQREIFLRVNETFTNLFPESHEDTSLSMEDDLIFTNHFSFETLDSLKVKDISDSDREETSLCEFKINEGKSFDENFERLVTNKFRKTKSTKRKGRVSRNLTRIDFNQKNVIRGLREAVRAYFKKWMSQSQRDSYLQD